MNKYKLLICGIVSLIVNTSAFADIVCGTMRDPRIFVVSAEENICPSTIERSWDEIKNGETVYSTSTYHLGLRVRTEKAGEPKVVSDTCEYFTVGVTNLEGTSEIKKFICTQEKR